MLAPLSNTPKGLKTHANSVDPLPKISYKPFKQKTTFICKFCGGKGCKHENWLTYPASAIKGLNCDWITPNILATQRPSSRIIKEYNTVQEFIDAGINAIFNLQEPGEHPFCGDGIHPQSGFSYFPEEFSDHGIYYFNFGWKDMTATSTDVVLKILKQMSFSLANGNKIAIHCHAGRGRTGLIIAAWLIYNNNMTAKEAIKLVRSKRKGAIQNKSQEEVLQRLEKEIRESRQIFHASPRYKLEDFLFHQKKLLPLSTESETRFVPNLVLICLERLETLVTSKVCSAIDVALAFYNPNDATYYKGEWTNNHEKSLKSVKDKINAGNFELSEIDDPRFLTQSLLDYFDHFISPAIRNQFIDAIHENIHQQSKLTKEMKDEFFKKLDKKEFLLIECFARFFSKLINENGGDNDSHADHFRKAILRLCISLVLERKKWDKLFLKRSLIKEHSGEDRVTHLNVFMLKWIENFNSSFTEYYIVNKSPLKINEKLVQEKQKRRGSYLERVTGGNSISGRGSPDYSGSDEIKLGPSTPLRPIAFGEHGEAAQQPQQREVLSSTSAPKGRLSPLGASPRDPNRSSTPESNYSDMDVKSEGDPVRETFDHSKVKRPSLFKPGKIPDSQDRVPSSIFSPSRSNRATTMQPRFSLLKMDGPLIVADPSSASNTGNTGNASNINKNYDDFFSNNVLPSEESPRNSAEELGNESDGVSEGDRFAELLNEIDQLSEKKQNVILERLLKNRQNKISQ